MSYQILLVEDDSRIREVVYDYFTGHPSEPFDVHMAKDGEEALTMLYENTYDLLLLDIMLPKVDGFEICRSVRTDNTVPIIFITARVGDEDALYGYGLGADDYITKPFSLATLHAKCIALLKRSKGLVAGDLLTCGNIVMDPVRFMVTADGNDIKLSPKEFALLRTLIEQKGIVIPRETLLIRIWGYDYEGNERVLDNHIKKLRKALGTCGKQIQTVITKGYKITD
ncbi:MAG: response regulator transcription factor [Lachnospiraceae bacterium]|nr:response regulator transcription factor [Lachnospiraceae bacterium]